MTDDTCIYVVDDDESVRRALTRIFRAEGFKVLAFESADEFFAHQISEETGCLILDYRMPGESGIEVQQELMRQNSNLLIVFLTGHADVPTSVKAMKQGAVDFLSKPVDDHILIETVRNAVERSRDHLARNCEVREFKKRLTTMTQRESEVLMLVVKGFLNKQIASRLGVTEATVKVHRGRMMEKAGVDSVAELVLLCERSAILD